MVDRSSSAAGNLLVFADDWGRHPSSCQWLVRNLLPKYRVTWVNTIGTRAPKANFATLQRGFGKLRHWFHASSLIRPEMNLRVVNPWMWPSFSGKMSRRINCELLLRQLMPVIRALPEAPVAITTIPVISDLIGALPVLRWVYYCVDDFGVWPGLDSKSLQQMEVRLLQHADVIVAVSDNLTEKVEKQGRKAHLLTHGVDLSHWAVNGAVVPPELNHFERPLVVFWGVVDRRMDIAFVERLGAELTNGTILLVGPNDDSIPELDKMPRIKRLGPVEFERLPYIAREASALIMPYADLPVTRAMQPLKLKEYLATGKPVVVRDLPANRAWADCLDIAATAQEFSQLVQLRIKTGLPSHQRLARSRLADEGWQSKARAFAELAALPI